MGRATERRRVLRLWHGTGRPVAVTMNTYGFADVLRASSTTAPGVALHATAPCPPEDRLDVPEHVGRHNALDEPIGVDVWSAARPLSRTVLPVSGPSSLAVDAAVEDASTLIGLPRGTSGHRIVLHVATVGPPGTAPSASAAVR